MGGNLTSLKQHLEKLEESKGLITIDQLKRGLKFSRINLNQEEIEYLIFTMEKGGIFGTKYGYDRIFTLLEDCGYSLAPGEEVNSYEEPRADPPKRPKKEKEEARQPRAPPEPQIESPPKEVGGVGAAPVEDNVENNVEGEDDYGEDFEGDEEFGEMDEDKMIEMAQTCFQAIAAHLISSKQTMRELFRGAIQQHELEGELLELIIPEIFVEKIRSLGIEDFSTIHWACLIKVLSISDEDQFIRLPDLIQIMEDFDIYEPEEMETEGNRGDIGNTGNIPNTGNVSNPGGKRKGLDYSQLDEVSMVLMLALTDYVWKAEADLGEIFGEVVYQQAIKTKKKQITVDLINSSDFFAVLHKMGIKTDQSPHLNLQDFLCLDKNYRQKIYVKKLGDAMEEFAANEDLRMFAHQCYEHMLADEEAYEEEEGDERQRLRTIEEERKATRDSVNKEPKGRGK